MTLKSTVALSLCRYSRRRRSSSADRAFDPSSLSLSFFPDTAETRACLSVSESDDDEDRSARRRFRRFSSFLRSFFFFRFLPLVVFPAARLFRTLLLLLLPSPTAGSARARARARVVRAGVGSLARGRDSLPAGRHRLLQLDVRVKSAGGWASVPEPAAPGGVSAHDPVVLPIVNLRAFPVMHRRLGDRRGRALQTLRQPRFGVRGGGNEAAFVSHAPHPRASAPDEWGCRRTPLEITLHLRNDFRKLSSNWMMSDETTTIESRLHIHGRGRAQPLERVAQRCFREVVSAACSAASPRRAPAEVRARTRRARLPRKKDSPRDCSARPRRRDPRPARRSQPRRRLSLS